MDTANPDDQPPPKHGIIVVDAGSLFIASGKISQSLKQPNCSLMHYLEFLDYLGKNGFEIIIPEMVSIECAGVLGDGKCTHNPFKSSGNKFNTHTLQGYLKSVADFNHPGVILELQENLPPQLATYIDNHQVASGYKAQVRRLLTKEADAVDTNHFGDIAACTYIGGIKEKTPIFYLSEDEDASLNVLALKNNHPELDVSILNFKGMMDAMIHNGITTELGLVPKLTLDNMNDEISRARREVNHTDVSTRELISIDSYFNPRIMRSHFKANNPFYKAVAAMRTSLAQKNEPVPASESPPPNPPEHTHVEEYLARYEGGYSPITPTTPYTGRH